MRPSSVPISYPLSVHMTPSSADTQNFQQAFCRWLFLEMVYLWTEMKEISLSGLNDDDDDDEPQNWWISEVSLSNTCQSMGIVYFLCVVSFFSQTFYTFIGELILFLRQHIQSIYGKFNIWHLLFSILVLFVVLMSFHRIYIANKCKIITSKGVRPGAVLHRCLHFKRTKAKIFLYKIPCRMCIQYTYYINICYCWLTRLLLLPFQMLSTKPNLCSVRSPFESQNAQSNRQ